MLFPRGCYLVEIAGLHPVDTFVIDFQLYLLSEEFLVVEKIDGCRIWNIVGNELDARLVVSVYLAFPCQLSEVFCGRNLVQRQRSIVSEADDESEHSVVGEHDWVPVFAVCLDSIPLWVFNRAILVVVTAFRLEHQLHFLF